MDKQYNLKAIEKIMQYQPYVEKLHSFAEYLIFKITKKKQRVISMNIINFVPAYTENGVLVYEVETHYSLYYIVINHNNMTGCAIFE